MPFAALQSAAVLPYLNLLLSPLIHSQPLLQDIFSQGQFAAQPLHPHLDSVSQPSLPHLANAAEQLHPQLASGLQQIPAAGNASSSTLHSIAPLAQPWPAPDGPQFLPIGQMQYQFLQLCMGQHPEATLADLLQCAAAIDDASKYGR